MNSIDTENACKNCGREVDTDTSVSLCAHCPIKHRLVGWGDDQEFIDNYVLPRVFGHLVVLAEGVVKEFHSDLYRDAEWLPKNITGPCEMDYVVRHSGTHLGMVGATWNTARVYIDSPSMHTEGNKFYRLSLTMDDRREWWLTVTDVTVSQ